MTYTIDKVSFIIGSNKSFNQPEFPVVKNEGFIASL